MHPLLLPQTENEIDNPGNKPKLVDARDEGLNGTQMMMEKSTRIWFEFAMFILAIFFTMTAFADVYIIFSLVDDYLEPFGLLLTETNLTKVLLPCGSRLCC